MLSIEEGTHFSEEKSRGMGVLPIKNGSNQLEGVNSVFGFQVSGFNDVNVITYITPLSEL